MLPLGLALTVLALVLGLATLSSCNSDPKSGSEAARSGNPKSARELEMRLPMAEPAGYPLVVLTDLIPSLQVELPYASSRNVARRRLYDSSMPAMLDQPTAKKLAKAQSAVLKQGYSLKVWDAYRPPEAHLRLWQGSGRSGYVADPRWGWSKHCSGRAVDVTLADAETGKEVKMPSRFDDFSKKASSNYAGSSYPVVVHLGILQKAMREAGFVGIEMEWWHFENSTRQQENLPPIYADEAGVSLPK